MISKESFVKIMDTLDEFFNGEQYDAMQKLGICESFFQDCMDKVISAIAHDVDPCGIARDDAFGTVSGCFICEWLFGEGEFQEECKTAGELYEYIVNAYINLAKENSEDKTSN